MNPSDDAIATRLLTESSPVWAWGLSVTAVGLLVAALMVLVQDEGKSGRRAAIWGLVIFLLPIIGPAVYLVWETVRYRREHGRPEKGMVEKYAPEEVAQRREDARQEESRRAAQQGGDRDAAAD